jgi:hypothetical protein
MLRTARTAHVAEVNLEKIAVQSDSDHINNRRYTSKTLSIVKLEKGQKPWVFR